jgi:murein DD-endopeptidase MepM/ murein hydrolase activator NlpD
VVATVSLTFDVLQNLRVTEPMPVVRVVPAGENLVLTRLTRVDSMASIGGHPVVEIDLGSDSTVADPEVRYALPFGGGAPRQLVAGYGSDTHLAENFYALDFAMPEGTPVLAARAGVVVEVQDGFTERGLRPELIERANLVAVAHADGTLASYGHLQAGILVSVGDTVAQGQRLGLSGSTGFSGIPHLHFHVGKRLMSGMDRTIKVRLQDGERGELDVIEGQWYGASEEVTLVRHMGPKGGPEGAATAGHPLTNGSRCGGLAPALAAIQLSDGGQAPGLAAHPR